MLSLKSTIPKKSGGKLQPILPLIPNPLPSSEEEKASYISFELKARVGAPEASTKYKKYMRKFEEGEPQQWIDLMRDMLELWTQNSITGGTDRASTVRALIRGESLTAFETALQEARTADDQEVPITAAHVDTALEAVAAVVFPHRSLEIQKIWMNRGLYKPSNLSTRSTSAAISRLNNSLPFFPSGTEADKFSENELIGLLEWSLPSLWREQFDLKGYIPTTDTRRKLIAECEAIERHVKTEDVTKKNENSNKNVKKNSSAKQGTKTTKSERPNKFYCTEHGHNPTHPTSDCFTIKNRNNASSKGGTPNNRSFSTKTFRKEVNLLARQSSKVKVLDMYETAIKNERSKLAKKGKKRKSSKTISSDDSDSDRSINVLQPILKKKTNTKSVTSSKKKQKQDTLEEESAYRKKVEWLKDHGDSDKDESTNKVGSDSESE